jgi:hypothetical protein
MTTQLALRFYLQFLISPWAGILGEWPISSRILSARVVGCVHLNFLRTYIHMWTTEVLSFSARLHMCFSMMELHHITVVKYDNGCAKFTVDADWLWTWSSSFLAFIFFCFESSRFFWWDIWKPRSMQLQSVPQRNRGFEVDSLQVK